MRPGDENTAAALVVDDDEQIRGALGRLLARQGYQCTFAATAGEARAALAAGNFALALFDVMMPGESGFDLLAGVRAAHPDLAVVMVTGVDDPALAQRALEAGVYGYVVKPFNPNQVTISVANAGRLRRLEMENRAYREDLERRVEERTAALRAAMSKLETAEEETRRAAVGTIDALARTIEHRDEETSAHVARMSRYSELIARRAGFDDGWCELVRMAAPMHDVGKIGVPDGILFKPGRLSHAEMEVVKLHSTRGADILGSSESRLLRTAAVIARTHHERWDGGGYPCGLAGTRIPMEGRIAAVADVFDAMLSRRVYKPAHPMETVVEHLRTGRGTQFDGDMVDLLLSSMDDVDRIRQEHPDP